MNAHGENEKEYLRRIVARRDLVGGAVIVSVGFFVMFDSSDYSIGTLRRMGPGFFPFVLGLMTTLFGLGIAIASRSATAKDYQLVRWRPAVCALLSILVFGLLVETTGLLPAVAALIAIAGLADPGQRPLSLFILFMALAPLVYLIFVVFLGIPLPLIQGLI